MAETATAFDRELYADDIDFFYVSMLAGKGEKTVRYDDPIFSDIAVLREWLAANDIQQIEVVSTNIGFVRKYRKRYRNQDR